jgi:hypothetical protein
MAGYTNNYGSYDSPEYQDKPNADSTNGGYGSQTPAARRNQQNYRKQPGGQTDPYKDLADSSRQWYPRQVPPAQPPQTSTPADPPPPATALSSLLRGVKPPVTSMPMTARPQAIPLPPPQTATVAPETAPEATALQVAQPSGIVTPPAMPPQFPQLPSTIPPVPSAQPAAAVATPPSALATTLRSAPPLAQGTMIQPPDETSPVPPATTPAPTITNAPPVVGPSVTTPSNEGQTMVTPPPVVGPSTTGNNTDGMDSATPPNVVGPSTTNNPSDTPQITDQQLADAYKSGQPFTAAQQAILDKRNPRPPNTDDPAVAAKWYQGFAFIDPTFANITAADVDNQRTLAVSGKFKDMGHPEWQDFKTWWRDGKPGGQYTPDSTMAPTVANHNPGGGSDVNNQQGGLPFDPKTGAPITTKPPTTTTPGGIPAPTTDPAAPPTGTPPAGPNASTSPDVVGQERALYDPLFKQQQSELARTLRAQAALDGSVNSGGFNESLGRAESNLSANQGAQLASLTEAERNRQQAMTIAVMTDATQRFGIKTNDDLQRWLNDPNNDTLQKYGIDKNDLLERYKAQLGLSSSEAMAGASFNAAALNAATSQAIAAGNNATQLKLGTMQNDLGWGQLQGNLYNNDQDRYIAELKMLSDAGLSQAAITQILQTFGPSPPVFTTHP